jgi:hypothetical protein
VKSNEINANHKITIVKIRPVSIKEILKKFGAAAPSWVLSPMMGWQPLMALTQA